MMIENGIDPVHFAEALEKIGPNLPKAKQESSGQDEKSKPASRAHESVLDYFSSHPVASDRIAAVLEYSKRFRQQRDSLKQGGH